MRRRELNDINCEFSLPSVVLYVLVEDVSNVRSKTPPVVSDLEWRWNNMICMPYTISALERMERAGSWWLCNTSIFLRSLRKMVSVADCDDLNHEIW